jgi:hypothetical protein
MAQREEQAPLGAAGRDDDGLGSSLPPSSSLSPRVGPSRLVERTDYVRLLQQTLRGLGYGGAADALERESVR